MTQIESQPNSENSKNHPADLNSIYEALAKLTASNNDPTISIPSPLSLIALTCHAFLISHSFRLNPSSTQPLASNLDPSLLTDWHSILDPAQISLLFSYSHPQSTFTFEFTFSKIGNRISIAGITVQDDRLSTWHLLISEYVDPSQFPIDLRAEEHKDSNGFRSSTHLLNFISLFVNEILNGLMADLFPITSINQRSPPRRMNQSDQQTCNNSEVTRPPTDRSYAPSRPIQTGLEIGRSDLEPIGTSNLGIPSLYNQLPRPGFDQQSGMMIHPNHPIFHPPSSVGPPGSFHPPGARFDPIGPNSSHPTFFSPPRPHPALDFDPMGGLGQGLPIQNPHSQFLPNRPDFNEFRPPGAGGSSYDDMFM